MNLGILYTGGTIGSIGDPLGPMSTPAFQDAFERIMTPVLQSDDSELTVGYIDWGATTLDSTNLQPADWCEMASLVLGNYERYDAFMILHGTDTMAYTASALSFMMTGLRPDGFPFAVLSKPIVVTGSQLPLFQQEAPDARPELRDNTDAFQNVCGGVLAASSGVPEVCLFFHDTLFRGNRSAKINASEFDAFASPNYPPLGVAGIEFRLRDDNTLHLPTTPTISLDDPSARAALQDQLVHLTSTISASRVLPFMAFPATYASDDPTGSVLANLMQGAIDQGVDGIVLQSYGEGNFPSGDPADPSNGAIHRTLAHAHDRGIVIVDNTHVLEGIVNSNAYASGSWLAEVGAVGAFDMTAICSYTKLVYLQALRRFGSNDWSQADVARLMQTNITGEIMDVDRLDTRGRWYLAPGESIDALDGSARLINDFRAGPILIDPSGTTLWSAMASPDASWMPGRLFMQGDGNLVFYGRSNTARWASGTSMTAEATSMLILDGSSAPEGLRLYLYDYASGTITATLHPS